MRQVGAHGYAPLRRIRTAVYIGIITAVLPATPARADQLEYTTYGFADNGNNGVFTSGFNLSKTLWKKTAVLLDIEVDRITVPPLQGITGASRSPRRAAQTFRKNRAQIIAGFEQGVGADALVSASYYQSREVDYGSQAVIGTWTQELFQKNTTVQARGQYTWDDVGEIDSTGELLNSFKETQQASFSVTQLLTPVTVLRGGADVMRQLGLLSDPYRLIAHRFAGDTADSVLKERHPAQRWRQAGWAEISHFWVPVEASAIVNYRFYFDDWGVKSHTVQFKLNKYVTRNWIASPEYRYYIQGDADFGDISGGDPDAYFSGDYKLKRFESNNIGLGLTYFLRGVATRRASLDFLGGASVSLMYFRYWNSLKFHSDMLETKVKFGF